MRYKVSLHGAGLVYLGPSPLVAALKFHEYAELIASGHGPMARQIVTLCVNGKVLLSYAP